MSSDSPNPPIPAGTQSGATRGDTSKSTYQIILRHLAKFSDGAVALFEHFDATSSGDSPGSEVETAAEESPLEHRIERHMNRVTEALMRIRNLNLQHEPSTALEPEARDKIETQQRTIQDIVAAELRFWAAAVENAPHDKFDDVERSWVDRIIRLAALVGVDSDHQESLKRLVDWT